MKPYLSTLPLSPTKQTKSLSLSSKFVVNARNLQFHALSFAVQASLVLPLPGPRPLPSLLGFRFNMLLIKQKKAPRARARARARLLISINVLGSAGPIRFVVNEDELVAAVIHTALKSYAREGRLPLLPNHSSAFHLYCPHLGSDPLSPWDTIGSHGIRNFLLCKKPDTSNVDATANTTTLPRRGSGSWKAWFNKSLTLKLSSIGPLPF